MTESPQKQVTRTVSTPSPKALYSLLSDSDDTIASLAMEQILNRLPDHPGELETYLQEMQDSEEAATRRHVQQLSAIVSQRHRVDEFIRLYQMNKLGFFEGALALDGLYSPKSSTQFVTTLSKRLFAEYSGSLPMTPASLSAFMTSHNFIVPRPPWFNIGYFMLGDILENGQGIPAMLCIIAHALARSHGSSCDICLSSGQFCLIFPDQTIVNPQQDWKITEKVAKEHFSVCNPQQLMRYCLAMAMTYSVAAWEIFDVSAFQEIFRRIDDIKDDFLPYPFGDYNTQEK